MAALASLFVFATVVVAEIRSFFVRDGIQWDPPVVHIRQGNVCTRIKTYEVCLARGVVCFDYGVEDWSGDVGGSPTRWFYYNFRPDSLFTEPTPSDRINVRFAGFGFYRGDFKNQVAGLQVHTVYSLLIPLWPLLVTAAPPLIWWRRSRRRRAGFAVVLPTDRPSGDPAVA